MEHATLRALVRDELTPRCLALQWNGADPDLFHAYLGTAPHEPDRAVTFNMLVTDETPGRPDYLATVQIRARGRLSDHDALSGFMEEVRAALETVARGRELGSSRWVYGWRQNLSTDGLDDDERTTWLANYHVRLTRSVAGRDDDLDLPAPIPASG